MKNGITPATFNNEKIAYITQGWPEYTSGGWHLGIDLAMLNGLDKCYAIEDSTIESIRIGNKNQTHSVGIRGKKSGYLFYYTHQKTIYPIGTELKEGQEFGYPVADLIRWAGYHLHFQIEDGTKIDPIEYFFHYQPDLVYRLSVNMGALNYYQKKSYYSRMVQG